jgi:hypothetical protein
MRIVSLPPNHPFGTIEFVNGNVSIQEKQIELEQNNAIICGDSTIGLYQTLLELRHSVLIIITSNLIINRVQTTMFINLNE